MDILNESKFQARQVAYCARADQAQRWARRLIWLTFAIGLFAVWQHRDLAPPVHDGMFLVANVATDVWGGAHETRGVVQGLFSGGSDNGGSQEFNAITRWLLDNR
ncbi:MAG: hypothetical protein AAF641_01005 [Pseudomonadota bacterium]